MNALHEDHLNAEARHREVEMLGSRWPKEGRLSTEAVQRMAGLLEQLRTISQIHICLEDTEIFPLAREILDRSEIKALGREMAVRRGIHHKAP